MTAIPPRPPIDGEQLPGAPPNAILPKKGSWDDVVTFVLHLGLLMFWLPVCFFIGVDAVMIAGNCANVSCDGTPFAFADTFVRVGLLSAVGSSVVVSVVLLIRRRHAWYVPLAAGTAMVIVVAVAMIIVNFARF